MKSNYLMMIFIFTWLLQAQDVEISQGITSVEIQANDKYFVISREQNPESYLTNSYALTSRPSPPFFIEPFQVNDKVETYGELEVIEFLKTNSGVFIDARLENWFEESAIAGAVNIPFKLFLEDSSKRDAILIGFGAKKQSDGSWGFTKAKKLLFYCNGAWCGQSPTAIKALVEIGYPQEKMKYYRGGMQEWQLLGLSTVVPKKEKK